MSKNTTNGTKSKSTERTLKMESDGHGGRVGQCMSFYNNVHIKNCIVDYEQGVSDVRWGYVNDEEVQQLWKIPVISPTFAFEERATVNPQVSLLDLTLEAGIPDDVVWSLIDGKHIVSVTHHDGLLVDRADGGLDEELMEWLLT